MLKKVIVPYAYKLLIWLYCHINNFLFGVKKNNISKCNNEIIEENVRQPVYSLRGFLDSFTASVVLVGLTSFVIIGVLLTSSGKLSESKIYLIFQFLWVIFLLMIYVDDFLRSRMLNSLSPCRSLGRFGLDFFANLIFACSFIFFNLLLLDKSYNHLSNDYIINNSFGIFFLASGFASRALWAIRANNEAYAWECYILKVKDKKNEVYPIPASPGLPIPSIFEENSWELHRLRVKNVILFSFFYCFFFLLIAYNKKIGFSLISKFENMLYGLAITTSKEIFSINIKMLGEIIFIYLVFLIIELIRFREDVKALKKFELDYSLIKAENFASAIKTVVYMPPFMKEYFTRKILK